MGEYKKLINYLKKYRLIKVRLESIKLKEKNNKLESHLLKEKKEKEEIISLIDSALKILDEEQELPLIQTKYLKNVNKRNSDIYNTRDFPYSSSQYYRVKKRALKKLDQSIGDLL